MRGGVSLVTCVMCLAAAAPAAAQGHTLDEDVPPPFGEAPLGGGMVVDPGWSVEAFWLGVGAALGVLTTGIIAVAIGDTDDDRATGFGIASMSIVGLAGPTVAWGGASARGHPYVPGSSGVRIAAWLTWSLSLVAGVSLLASDIDESNGRRGAFMAPVALGAVGLLLFAFDALVSAIQADLVTGSAR